MATVPVTTVGGVTTATYATNSLAVGSHSITAVYGGDAIFNASVSAALSHTVSATTTTSRNVTQETVVESQAAFFNLKAYPNPALTHFTVKIESSNTQDKIRLRVVDLSGKTTEIFENVMPNTTMRLGATYNPGVYFIEMIQGKNRKLLKVMKQSD